MQFFRRLWNSPDRWLDILSIIFLGPMIIYLILYIFAYTMCKIEGGIC